MRAKNSEGHVRTLGGETKYRLIRVNGKQRLEHRVVMEQRLGRPLLPTEVVHHKDEDGCNNVPDNLEVNTRLEHRRVHGGPRKWKITLEEAVRLRGEGKTLQELAELAGVTWTAIRHVFRRRGIPTADVRHGTTSWDLERAVRRYENHWPMEAIAREAGVTAPSVKKAFAKRGLLRS